MHPMRTRNPTYSQDVLLRTATRVRPRKGVPLGHSSGLWRGLAMSAILLVTHAAPALDLKPTRAEMRAERTWLKEHLLDSKFTPARAKPVEVAPPPTEPGLDVFANNDPVVQNGRGKNPMKIRDQEFSRGLYCHAVSKVEVRLPGAGQRFKRGLPVEINAKPGAAVVFYRKMR